MEKKVTKKVTRTPRAKKAAVKKATVKVVTDARVKKATKRIVSETVVAQVGAYWYGLGRRKCAIARVRVFKKGKGKIIVNDKDCDSYFPHYALRDMVRVPLVAVGKADAFDVSAKVQGGGLRGQAEAVRLGIARALLKYDEALRPTLKPLHVLTRDPRVKERKKPGLRKARRAPQWAKR